MNRKERIHQYISEIGAEVLAFIKERENMFSDRWVPATEIKETLELNFVSVPRSNKQYGEKVAGRAYRAPAAASVSNLQSHLHRREVKMRRNRIPVSTIETGCVPFNRTQTGKKGYKVGENPVKDNGIYIETFEDALNELRKMRCAGWRDFGAGNSQSAHKAIGWVSVADAAKLLSEP
ncbi:MAG: hypothetical protein KDI34_22785, partial [Halioglobus sp.]|nr:hypothetical protein [Halioglobus sp.]